MKKILKKLKAFIACCTRTDQVWIVYSINKESIVSIILVTYEMEDAIEFMNKYNTRNKESAWLTKQIII